MADLTQQLLGTAVAPTWPYSTNDEVSHLAMTDVGVLRARIDQLLEERREARKQLGFGDVTLPAEWRLTATEHRFFAALVAAPAGKPVNKERLHNALSGGVEPETDIKIVDVIACKVRKKLQPFGVGFETVWGQGYMLSPAARAQLTAPQP